SRVGSQASWSQLYLGALQTTRNPASQPSLVSAHHPHPGDPQTVDPKTAESPNHGAHQSSTRLAGSSACTAENSWPDKTGSPHPGNWTQQCPRLAGSVQSRPVPLALPLSTHAAMTPHYHQTWHQNVDHEQSQPDTPHPPGTADSIAKATSLHLP